MAVTLTITAGLIAVFVGLLVGIGIGRELARRKASEANARIVAERETQVTDELLGAVSHELRTPLNAIVGWVHLLKSNALGRAETARALESIERNAHAETLLISNLLDEARLRRRLAPLRIAPFDLESIVRDAVNALSMAAKAHGVELAVAHEEAPLMVDGDRDRLEQAVWNLVSNAIKFTPMGGHVRIEIGRTNGDVQVRVIDSGEGIDPAFLPHIFEPFRQGQANARRPGVGLGLSIVKQIVELHGGAVGACSPGRGRGATVWLTVPAHTPVSAAHLVRHEPEGDERNRYAEQPRYEVPH